LNADALAHPNIALVKYWGKRDTDLNLPTTSSLSVTLDRFHTCTAVHWDVRRDEVVLDGQRPGPRASARVLEFLDLLDPHRPPCRVVSESNFPVAAGLASSSSAFAALAVAASAAAGFDASPRELSVLARRGSGSACRSLWGGFVRWDRGILADGSDSHGSPVLPGRSWDLRVVVAVVHAGPKELGSREGMLRSQRTSPCYPSFVSENELLVRAAERAVVGCDLAALAEIMERSTLLMQATMHTSRPSIRYSRPGSLAVLDRVLSLKRQGIRCGWTMDAGPNVKVLCGVDDAHTVARALEQVVARVHVLGIGGPPELALGDEE